MTTLARILLMLLTLCLAPRKSLAQTDSCSKFLVPMTVRDARGELVHKFSAGDLDIKSGQTPVRVESIHPETRPRRIVILLDASASMKGTEKEVPWRRAIASAQFLAGLSEGRARLALLIFNKKIVEEIGFADDNTAITKRLNVLLGDEEYLNHSVQGTTHLYDALNRALQLLGKPTSADALYISSDAGENNSRLMLPTIKRELLESGVRVFLTRLETLTANHRDMTPEELNAQTDTESLVEQTGGERMTWAPQKIALGFKTRPIPTPPEGVRMFYAGLFENDVLEFDGPLPNTKKRDLKIAVSTSARDRLSGAQLAYPHLLCLCTPPKSASSAP